MNKNIAIITAGILVVGFYGIASLAGNVWAASSSGAVQLSTNGQINGNTQAAAAPGQSTSSAGGGTTIQHVVGVPIISPGGNFANTGVGSSSSASDKGSVTTAAGSAVTCAGGTGGGSSSGAGSCGGAVP